MKHKRTTALILVVAGLAFVGPSHAVCKNARIVSTLFPRGSYSYIHTPGVEPSATSSSITDDFEGAFWALGLGGPEFQQGHDSGAFVALGEGHDGWVQHPFGYPATFHTTWGSGRNIDGCIDKADIKTTCTVVLLSDQHESKGYFALLSAAPQQGNYSFVQPDNGPITLALVPAPRLVDTLAATSNVQATVRIDAPSSGLFLDTRCPAAVVRGYRIYSQVIEQGESAPTDRERLRSVTSAYWRLSKGGETPSGDPLALGTAATVAVDCTPNSDVYLAVSIVFDSGFETNHLSENSRPIRCGGSPD